MSLAFLNPFRAIEQRRLDRALERYQESPGIDETVAVVRHLLGHRDHSRAFQYADNGYQRFPSSDELLELRQLTLKEMSRHECRELTRTLWKNPQPDVIAKVIEIRRSLGEFSACEKLSQRWRSRFPESWILQFSIGKYLFQRSLVEKDPKISTRCLDQLKAAAELNPKSYKTLLYLATLLYQLGSIPQAIHVVKILLRHHPNDPKARALRGCIRKAQSPSSVADGGAECQQDDVELDDLATGSVYGVFVHRFDGDGPALTLSSVSGEGCFDFGHAESVIPDLTHSMSVSASRMGIGELEMCALEGESWRVLFRNDPRQSVMVFGAPDLQEEQFEGITARIDPENTTA